MKTNRTIFTLLLTSAILLFVFVPSRITAVFLYSLIFCTLASFLSALLCFLGVTIDNLLNTPVIIRGEKGEFELVVKNRIPLAAAYINPVFTEQTRTADDNKNLIFASPFLKDFSFKYQLTYQHCGIFEAGICELKIIDMLGIFAFKKTISQRSIISVFPKIFELKGLPISAYAESSSPTTIKTKTRDTSDIAGVRDYESRDSIKQIHWKLSVKQQKLLAKEYEEEKREQIRLIIWAKDAPHKSSQFDKVADCAVSILDSVLEKSCTVCLCCGNLSQEIRSNSEIPLASEMICGLTEYDNLPDSDDSFDSGEWVTVIVASNADDSALDRLAKLASAGKVIFIATSENQSDEEKSLMQKQNRLRIQSFYSTVSSKKIVLKEA